jgi:hypothetical protein
MKSQITPSGNNNPLISVITKLSRGNYIEYKGKVGRDGRGTLTHIFENDLFKQKDQILKNGKRKRTIWEK